jgi:nucleotide-binding universal stress UspA family protein
MKILLAVDGSAYTKRMLAYLAAHDDLLGPRHEYTAITVVTPIPGHAASFVSPDVLDTYYREEAEAVLKSVEAFAQQQRWPIELVSTHGHAADVIASQAESGRYDLLIMGSHGHSSLTNVVLWARWPRACWPSARRPCC